MTNNLIPLKNKLQRIGFSVRQFLAIFFIVSIILFVIQLYAFQNQINKNRDSVASEISINLEQADTFIDYYISSIQELLRTSIMRDDLFNNGNDVEKLLAEISNGMIGVHSVFAKQINGNIICGNQLFYDILDNEHVKTQMKRSKKKPNGMIWSEPYYSNMQANNTMCVAYTDAKSGKVIAAEVNLWMLYQNLSKSLRNKGQSFIIRTKNENVIIFDVSTNSLISTVKGKYPSEIQPDFIGLKESMNKEYEFFRLSAFDNIYFMQSSKNIAGWYVTAVIDDNMFNKGVSEIKTGFGISLIFGLSMICIAVYIVVFYFTKPLRQLAETMESVKDLNTLKTIDNNRVDEVGRLTECYNRLVLRIQKLVQDIKEAEQKKAAYEFRMHQSQIGPHFLRNTLYCIASLLRQERTRDAETAIKSLAGLLSYSFDNSEPNVYLSQEINSLEKYISIQKVRYGDTFTINIRCQKNVENCIILKLVLQPLVENAIIHGLPSITDGNGKISIRIYRHGDILAILVADNGCGMSVGKVKEALNFKNEEFKKDRYYSIGIANVNERIRLNYGENYGLKIVSKLGKGTIVRIKLPYSHA